MSVAVGRFVAVGEAIATENQELKDEMGQACFEARRAGRHLWPDLIMCCNFTELLRLNSTLCRVFRRGCEQQIYVAKLNESTSS